MSKQLGEKPKSPRNGQPVPSNPNGRPKGSVNKFTTLKKSFLNVFEQMGGDEALLAFAKTHKPLFYQMITKLFPQEVEQIGSVKVNFHLCKPPQDKDEHSRT
jgi:hypothetical protein